MCMCMCQRALIYMCGLLDELAAETAAESSRSGTAPGRASGAAGRVASGQLAAPLALRPDLPVVPVVPVVPVGEYSPPVHMPVLLNVRVLWEMEARWPEVFARTRLHRDREGEEVELNFLYHNYLRLRGYPTARHHVHRFGVGFHLVEVLVHTSFTPRSHLVLSCSLSTNLLLPL